MIWHTMIMAGTAAAVLGLHLFLLKLSFNGRRPFFSLAERWVAAPAPVSAFVLALLTAVAASAFATMPAALDPAPAGTAASEPAHGGVESDEEIAALRDYAAALGEFRGPVHADAKAGSMPGVDEMIAQLAARLKQKPDDARGWKMLGWSYLNTGRAVEAVSAYEAALRLLPGDGEIVAGLDAAKAALAADASARENAPSGSTP